jgi:hypothetical protein
MNAGGYIRFLTFTGVGIVKFDMPSILRLLIPQYAPSEQSCEGAVDC